VNPSVCCVGFALRAFGGGWNERRCQPKARPRAQRAGLTPPRQRPTHGTDPEGRQRHLPHRAKPVIGPEPTPAPAPELRPENTEHAAPRSRFKAVDRRPRRTSKWPRPHFRLQANSRSVCRFGSFLFSDTEQDASGASGTSTTRAVTTITANPTSIATRATTTAHTVEGRCLPGLTAAIATTVTAAVPCANRVLVEVPRG
jgi:hypothetical protein